MEMRLAGLRGALELLAVLAVMAEMMAEMMGEMLGEKWRRIVCIVCVVGLLTPDS